MSSRKELPKFEFGYCGSSQNSSGSIEEGKQLMAEVNLGQFRISHVKLHFTRM